VRHLRSDAYSTEQVGADPGIYERGAGPSPSLPFFPIPLLSLFPPLTLISRPLKTGWGSAVSAPSVDRGRAPAENEFGAF